MTKLVRHVEDCWSPAVSVPELIRSGPEVAFSGRKIDVRGQAGKWPRGDELMRELGPDVALIMIGIAPYRLRPNHPEADQAWCPCLLILTHI